MSISQWWKVVTVLVVAGATASGVEWLGDGPSPGNQAPAARQEKALAGDAPTQEVKRGKLELRVDSRGSVEAARASSVYCNVEGGTTIIKIVPEGTKVRKGEVITELDSAALKDRLINQRITTKSAEANYFNARLTREVAEIALKEYVEGIFKKDVEALEREIEGGRSAIRKIEERLARTRKALERLQNSMNAAGRGMTTPEIVAEVDIRDRIEEAELSRDRERRKVADAEARRDVLEKYTRKRTVMELEGEIRKAHSDELARQATWELEKSKESKLETMIMHCTLVAPMEGLLVYAKAPGANRPAIEEGATVRERQHIAYVVDVQGPMRINAKVREAMISQIRPKQKVQVKVDAFPDELLDGEITEVAPLPDAGNFFNQNIKVYTTRIRLDKKPAGLRPGMTAQARIVVDRREDAIGVPSGAVVSYDGKSHVAIKRPDGRVEWREVVVGNHGDQAVEVTEGLREGEQVILDPTPFLSGEQKRKMNAPAGAAPRKAAAARKGKRTAANPAR